MSPDVVITIDVHATDDPRAIDRCSEWLAERSLPATFFVPTALLHDDHLGPPLRRLGRSVHAIGTHGHEHDWSEAAALRESEEAALGFLRESRELYEAVYGQPPEFFRAPAWRAMSDAAFVTLEELGYRVDCSSTPQRPGILSSDPRRSPWLRARRKPHFVCGRLLEVPTSCFLVPLASPTFLTLGRKASLAFLRLLALEAAIRSGIVLNIMLHPSDFHLPSANRSASHPPRRLTLLDLVPQGQGGLMWRHHLRCRDPEKIVRRTHELVASVLSAGVLTTLTEIYARSRTTHMSRQPRSEASLTHVEARVDERALPPFGSSRLD